MTLNYTVHSLRIRAAPLSQKLLAQPECTTFIAYTADRVLSKMSLRIPEESERGSGVIVKSVPG
jgi:hypothetical protein